MQLEHSFTVPVGIDEAWRILLDIERIGPCMPGAVIESVDGDDFTGSVKVKLGPINLTYKGRASFIEKDEAAHRAVIDARGRDARGNGTASAKVTANLSEEGAASTAVHVATDLDITGKPAQFGRGVMVDVGNKLIGQFADCLATTITAGDGGPAGETPPAEVPPGEEPAVPEPAADLDPDSDPTPAYGAPGGIPAAALEDEPGVNGRATPPRPSVPSEVEPIDLLQSAGPAVAKRLAPVAVAGVVVLLAIRWARSRRA